MSVFEKHLGHAIALPADGMSFFPRGWESPVGVDLVGILEGLDPGWIRDALGMHLCGLDLGCT